MACAGISLYLRSSRRTAASRSGSSKRTGASNHAGSCSASCRLVRTIQAISSHQGRLGASMKPVATKKVALTPSPRRIGSAVS